MKKSARLRMKNQMVGLTRFELVTSSMSTRHSNQLSYNPIDTPLMSKRQDEL